MLNDNSLTVGRLPGIIAFFFWFHWLIRSFIHLFIIGAQVTQISSQSILPVSRSVGPSVRCVFHVSSDIRINLLLLLSWRLGIEI